MRGGGINSISEAWWSAMLHAGRNSKVEPLSMDTVPLG